MYELYLLYKSSRCSKGLKEDLVNLEDLESLERSNLSYLKTVNKNCNFSVCI